MAAAPMLRCSGWETGALAVMNTCRSLCHMPARWWYRTFWNSADQLSFYFLFFCVWNVFWVHSIFIAPFSQVSQYPSIKSILCLLMYWQSCVDVFRHCPSLARWLTHRDERLGVKGHVPSGYLSCSFFSFGDWIQRLWECPQQGLVSSPELTRGEFSLVMN